MICKYCIEFQKTCVNSECPCVADGCPLPDEYKSICKYAEEGEIE